MSARCAHVEVFVSNALTIACLTIVAFASVPARLTFAQEVDLTALSRARTHAARPTTPSVTAEDLRTRLFIFADDSMGGRALATPGHMKAAMYIAQELRRSGLEPAGENGTYFQTLPVFEVWPDSGMRLSIGDAPLVLWRDYMPRDQGLGVRSIDGVPSQGSRAAARCCNTSPTRPASL
jgi:hypothetical protein